MATVEKRGNSYRITVSCGTDYLGNRIRKTKTWKPDPSLTKRQIEKELERQKVLLEEDVRKNRVICTSEKFADVIERWLQYDAEINLRKTTVAGYKSKITRILLALGGMKISDISPAHLMAFYDNLRDEGIKENLKYKSETLSLFLEKQNISQSTIAKNTGLTPSVVNRACQGQNVNQSTAEKICNYLGLDINTLFVIATENTKLSNSTIRQYHMILSAIFQYAMITEQLIISNPCKRIKTPKGSNVEAPYLNEEEVAELFSHIEEEPIENQTLFIIAVNTGMRRGELCGLTWNDIDLDNKIIEINKTLLYLPSEGVFNDTTKTRASQRAVSISADDVELLKQHKNDQENRRKMLEPLWVNNNYVFTDSLGGRINPDTVSARFKNFARKHGYPNISLKALRHTSATLQILNGINIRTVAGRLGHSKTTTTVNTYAHAIRTADERAAESINNIIKRRKEK